MVKEYSQFALVRKKKDFFLAIVKFQIVLLHWHIF